MSNSILSVVNNVGVKDDFSFVDTLGSFIGNRGFEETYQQFQENQPSPQAFPWEALSAIGNELGQTIHQNIRDYIDLVSNVDRCKVGNIQSMLNMYGQRYNIVDNIAKYPLEVQNLMDIFSMSRKYLLRNGFLKDDFVRDLENSGAIQYYQPLGQGKYEFQDKVLVQEDYDRYVKGVFKTLISGFLDLEYNDFGNTKVRSMITQDDLRGYQLSSFDEGSEDSLQAFKNENNIPASFDERAIVDAIDGGQDSLENYHGAQLELLEMEIQLRAQTLHFTDRTSKSTLYNTEYDSVEQKTRYSYYRKAKLIEYYRFVEDFFSQQTRLSSVTKYAYDQSYFEFKDYEGSKPLVWNGTSFDIDEAVVDQAAEMLKDIASYIATLRERLKLQTRKNYMRGTANLLIYLINQYMVDYAKTNTTLFSKLSSSELLSSLSQKLRGHSVNNVDVIEYFDETEYFNISAQTNDNALNGKNTNGRYWQGWESQTTDQFTTDEIVRFYLRDLQLSSDSSVSNLIEFLDIIYNLGANTSYIDKDTGMFTAKISSDPDVYSITLYHALTCLQLHWGKLQEYMLSDYPYSYPDDALSNQISNVVDEYISGYLSVQHLSAVSSVYDAYIDQLYHVSSMVDQLNQKYGNFLSDEYQFYYLQSERDICYNNRDHTDKQPGNYKYDYYIDNDKYKADDIYHKLTAIQEYSLSTSEQNPRGNIVFHGLEDTTIELSTQLLALSARYRDQADSNSTIYGRVKGYGYIDISSDVLHDALDDCEQFVKTQIDLRLDYLKSLVAQFLQTARDLKTQYGTLESTYSNAIANWDDSDETTHLTDSVLYTPWWRKGGTGGWNRYETLKKAGKKSDGGTIVKAGYNDTLYWYTDRNGGDYTVESHEVGDYPTDGTLEVRVDNMLERLEVPYFFVNGENGGDYLYRNGGDGIYAACVEVKNGISEVENSYDTLVAACNSIGLDFSTAETDINEKLDDLINYLTKVDAIKKFANDPTLKDLNEIKSMIIILRSDYTPKYDEYQNMPSDRDFSYYLGSFNFKANKYSFAELSSLLQYVTYTDDQNRGKIKTSIQDMFADYTDAKKTFTDIELSVQQEVEDYGQSGTIIERQMEYMKEALLNDIDVKKTVGYEKIAEILEDVRYHMGYVENGLSDLLSTDTKLSDAAITRMRELDYRDRDEYLSAALMYDMYNGLCATSDIYYNYKNITHPSRQYHPYLWNFIDADEMLHAFQNIFNLQMIENLNEERIQSRIDQYIGEFGQQINFWKNEGIDYTGYSSRYEMSEHLAGQLASTFQKVVDYDGAFFPDAVDFWWKYGAEGVSSALDYGMSGERDFFANCFKFWNDYGMEGIETARKYGAEGYPTETYDASAAACFRFWDTYGERGVSEAYRYGTDDSYNAAYQFYKDYYLPLGLDKEDLRAEQQRILRFCGQISAMTTRLPENQVFDMYKYGLDMYDNSYCLFKRYRAADGQFIDLDRISYSVKKNTPGKLWVRRSAHPFAFPAFSHDDGVFQIHYEYTSFSYAVSAEMQEEHDNLSGVIYDFEFSRNKSALAIITQNYFDNNFKRLDTANIFGAAIDEMTRNGTRIEPELQIRDLSVQNDERIEKAMPQKERASEYTEISSMGLNDIEQSVLSDVAQTEMSVVFSSMPLSTLIPQLQYPGTPLENLNASGALSDILDYDIRSVVRDSSMSSIISATQQDRYLSGYFNGYLYSYVGCQLNGNGGFYFAFAKKRFHALEPSGGEPISSVITLEKSSNYRLADYSANGNLMVDAKGGTVIFPRNPSTDDVVISLCDKRVMSFAVLVDSMLSDDTSMIDAYMLSGRVLSASNSNGYVLEDPYHKEMNSHDVFTSDVFTMNFSIRSDYLDPVDNGRIYNINADISYLPLYPGKEELAVIPDKEAISSNPYFPMELLGQSRNIDDLIAMVNPTPDPYFTIEDIDANEVFGRVYEDYLSDYDKTLKILGNPPINNNVPQNDNVWYDESGAYVWKIDLRTQFGAVNYTDKDYRTLRVLMFNRNNYGKNPYYVCDLSSAAENDVDAFYIDDVGGFEVEVDANIDATGTYDNKNVNSMESNRFNNISGIRMRFQSEGDLSADGIRTLFIYFDVDDISLIDHTFVNKDQICLCLMNDRDLSMFRYYHYLDAYGLYISAEMPDFSMYTNSQVGGEYAITGDGFRIQYDRDFINQKLSAGYWNYFFDKYGRKQYLREIDFDQYDALSDMEVFQGYKKALFKYDEELQFSLSDPNFYYPTINLKYPKTYGSYMNDRAIGMNLAEGVNLTSVFSDNELFLIDVVDSDEIFDSIGRVRIDISTDNSDFFMVDEEYFKSEDNQYSYDDPRMLEYVMFTENLCCEPHTQPLVGVQNREIWDVTDELATSVYLSDLVHDSSLFNQDEISTVYKNIPRYHITGTTYEHVVSGILSTFQGYTAYHVRTNGDIEGFDDIDVNRVFSSAALGGDALYDCGTGVFPMKTEDGIIKQTVITDISQQQDTDIRKLLRIYVNYKKDMENGGIVLYFNYFNYLNTPFIKMEDFRVYSEILEGTYLKLMPGEQGKLDIVIQFRYFSDGDVRGIKNLKVLSYQIYNISDDKPKFVMREVYRIGKDSDIMDSVYDVNVYGGVSRISFPDDMENTDFKFMVRWDTTAQLQQVKFDITFDSELFGCRNPDDPSMTLDTSSSPSVATITVTDPTKSFINIPMYCKLPNIDMKSAMLTTSKEIIIDDLKFIPTQPENIMNIVNVDNGKVEVI